MKKNGCLIVALILTLLIPFAGAEELLFMKHYEVSENGEAIIDDVSECTVPDANGQNRVFYEIFVGSFSDSDGDGTGDIRGIINRMDYLNDGDPNSGLSLGVEGIWLTPVFTSSSYHKYDVTDYYTVDPAFGTNEDLKELIGLCHERGVLVILDLPINHTSVSCRWFKNFSNAHLMHNPKNSYYDFYSYIPNDSPNPAGRHFVPLRNTDVLVEANFSDDMPELNFDREEVRQAVLDVAKYWLEMGVDGFRFDAAKYVYFGDHEKTVGFWTWYISELKKIREDVYTVAEVWDGEGITDRYAPVMNCFNFSMAQVNGLIAETAKHGDVNKFTSAVEKTTDRLKALRSDAMNILFISNHDMDRCAGYLTVASGYMKMAANLYLLSPGSPFIYYGEEIGMRGSRGGANTDANRRLAMLWGDRDAVQDPVGTTYESKQQTPYTVSDLLGNGDGILNYYKRLIMIRKAHPAIAAGEYQALNFPDTKAGGFIATLNGTRTLVIHNTTANTKTLDLSLVDGWEDLKITDVIGAEDVILEDSILKVGSQTSAILE